MESPELPDVLPGDEYLLAILFDVGPVQQTGFGSVAISEQELLAWQINQEHDLTPWECATVRQLSGEYASMLASATASDCPAPYSEEVEAVDHKKLQEKFRAAAAIRAAPTRKASK